MYVVVFAASQETAGILEERVSVAIVGDVFGEVSLAAALGDDLMMALGADLTGLIADSADDGSVISMTDLVDFGVVGSVKADLSVVE